MDIEKLKSQIESILFLSGEAVKISRIAKITGVTKPEVENALMLLHDKYSGEKSGIVILRKEEEAQMARRGAGPLRRPAAAVKGSGE